MSESGKAAPPGACVVWFRQDLRLSDHPALCSAAGRGPVIPLYVWAPEEEGEWPPGAASRWWLHHSLESLDAQLRRKGSRLIVRRGPTLDAILDVVEATGARAIRWSRRYEPAPAERDARVESALRARGVEVEHANASLLFEPWTVSTGAGRPYQVYTPFWKACLAKGDPTEPLAPPRRLVPPARWPASLPLESLQLLPAIDWAGGIRRMWKPGERGALARLDAFLEDAVAHYAVGRDRMDRAGTSRLSPHLHFGEIGPRQIAWALRMRLAAAGRRRSDGEKFLSELGWREFAHHLLHHFPRTPREPLREGFRAFPWRRDARALRAWQRGRTGYPLVDAAMRELWETGWMHNRARMISASFLVKHLLIPWREGARWFWDTLVDADLANNTFGWQWTAGCGADAAPYFRIFNPVTQGEKFDPEGDYVRRFVPELSRLPAAWIHRPWEAPEDLLARAGVRLGESYPRPIVDHAAARARALAALERCRA